MNRGVQQKQEPLFRVAVNRRIVLRTGGKTFRVGLILFGLLSIVAPVSSALGANAAVGFGSAVSLFMVGGSTITDTGYHA
jgi:hypothetical protein